MYGEGIIKANEIALSSSSGADINIEIDAKNISTSASSGAAIEISGKAINHASNAASGSSINAYNLKSNNVIVSAASGADIDVFASEKIEAKASSGGDVDFKGNPKKYLRKVLLVEAFLKNTNWKLKRVLSYKHQPYTE